MGAVGFMHSLRGINFLRIIGLSATPLRLWDEEGENEFIENLFNSHYPDYTFNFPMEKAIGTFLVKYNYFPYFTNLTEDEFDQYLKYTAKIPFGKDGKINTMAALRRQLLLDQAENKAEVLIDILSELVKKGDFYWTLVYCPKGRTDDQDEDRIIHYLGEQASKKFPSINIQFFVGETKDRDLLLKDFERKNVNMLFAIKVLDEGVNVPMAQNAIFLASGKNYREFVQRRGRILRKYKTDTYEKTHANIYDIVVLPTLKQYNSNKTTAKKLIISEFRRLFEFYKMSIPNESIFWEIENE
jgi:superfamily II DNA or RNA helicase